MMFMNLVIKLLLPVLCLSMVISASVFPASARDQTSPQLDRKAYFNAKQFLDEGAYEPAVEAFQKFLADFPKSPLIPEAHFLIGQAYFQLKQYTEAVDSFKTVVEGFPTASFVNEARAQLGKAYVELGMVDEAIPILEQEAALNKDPQKRQELYAKIADLYLSNREGLKAVDALLKQLQLVKNREERLPVELKIRQMLEQLNDQQLYRLFAEYSQSYPGDEALLRLSETAYKKGDFFRAERYLNQFLGHFPKHPSTQRAKELLTGILNEVKSYRFRLGVLLPLTGPQASYAQSVLKGIQLAMEDTQGMFPEKYVGLVVRDFEGQSTKLKSAFEELVKEYNSIAVIGPLLSKDVTGVASLAGKYQTPLITPTATANKLAQDNDYVFRDTVTPEFMGKTLAEYAMLKSGLKRFVIFYPKDVFGQEMMKILSVEVNRLGGEVIVTEAYPPDAMDFQNEIKQVIQLDLTRYGVLVPPQDPTTGQKPEYIAGFDGVFLLGDPLKTGLIASQLAFHDVKDRALLVIPGSGSSDFIAAGNRFVEGAILVDGFFEGSTDPAVRNFVSRYQAKYQESPDLFAAQAYDCIQMILLALKGGATRPDQIRNYLEQVRSFHGASGITTFHPKGQVEKQLFVIQVKKGKYVQVN
jgi:ABC-type branched-subunit amino acid transport system substrate-binding protein